MSTTRTVTTRRPSEAVLRLGHVPLPRGTREPERARLLTLLEQLQALLRQVNPYVQDFIHAAELPEEEVQQQRLVVSADARPADQHPRRYNRAEGFREVAVLMDEEPVHQDIVLRRRADAEGPFLQTVNETHRAFEALHFVLLLPFGTDSWQPDLRQAVANGRGDVRGVTLMQYYAHRLQLRPDLDDSLFRAGRLFQEYVCMAFARVETQRLLYLARNQAGLRAELYQRLQDALPGDAERELAGGDRVGQRVILPASFTGGPRYYQRRHVRVVAVKLDTAGRHSSEKLVEFVSQSPEETPEPILEVSSMIAETNSAGYILVQFINPTEDDMQLPAGYELGQTQLYDGLVTTVRVDPAGGQDQGDETIELITDRRIAKAANDTERYHQLNAKTKQAIRRDLRDDISYRIQQAGPSKLWQQLKPIIAPKKQQQRVPDRLSADELNNYFVSVGSDTKSSVVHDFSASGRRPLKVRLPRVHTDALNFVPVTLSELQRVISEMPNKISVIENDIPVHVLKLAFPDLTARRLKAVLKREFMSRR
ncbi:hypothetical protein FJT64_010055 [Amphibalanus amphitrite]|uniref:Helitron helicase-like domain-containing protein n=1 Tax=Amphibalanus amphitrite TaxID=1232801 RepID=A0A6A4VK61_AMPAM|nr:hypothetical protein FJT64_010055 [Amphibalanus amphitrite]